ncbi:hypothetical protein FB566_2365 [Stackebrandtia endophytica]|uniref:Uncharacterized protein n=2 Tax=Stackebrandtia endophytica TaxID=1496996 RepID=A0A543AW65_9ACTN|nr:hypothetical protein FB566_2365 [Stackebrandtia endophytica]
MARFDDPTGDTYGLPTYPWRSAPPGLVTRRQLRAAGLAPGGHDPVAQVMWKGVGGHRVAHLYSLALAVPKREATPAVQAAVEKALAARRTCPTCGITRAYYIRTSLGECNQCAEPSLYTGAAV